ncbi:hypothetical protein [Psychromonas aquatilis]|uniref:Uncharacterized protein n=1 Tax=Psychromonas aquatilis TaxID=2005072 RepID=A0ABU9GTC1_9GAMM
MEYYEQFKALLEEGSKLEGEVGFFFTNYTSAILGTVIFLMMLYLISKLPFIKAIHNYAISESSLEREDSEFIKMFKSPKIRIGLNIICLIFLVIMMFTFALFVLFTVSSPFLIWYKKLNIALFDVTMLCITLAAIELWVINILMRMKEQTSKYIRLDCEH